jgi:hypothetical protein
LTRRKALWICGGVWFFGLVASIIPNSGIKYFKTEEADFGFYGRSAVCLPMHLSPDRPAGWEYSVVFFIAVNFAAFTFMLAAYIVIFIKIRQSSRAVRSTAMNRESSLAKKVILIILTDFTCWMPVIIIGVMSLTRSFYDPSQQVYVWIAVFVLPVNSSINPFLYTLSNVQLCQRPSTNRQDVIKVLPHRLPGVIQMKGEHCDKIDILKALSNNDIEKKYR